MATNQLLIGAKYNDRVGNWPTRSISYNGKNYSSRDYEKMVNRLVGQYKDTTSQLSSQYKQDYASAKTANEARYGEVLTGYDDLISSGLNTLGNYGQAATTAVQDRYRTAKADTTAQLARSGMAGSTLTGQLNKSYASQEGKDLSSLQEGLAMQKLNYETGLTQSKLGVIQNREDEYPDAGLYNQQISSLTQSMAAQGIPMQYVLEAIQGTI